MLAASTGLGGCQRRAPGRFQRPVHGVGSRPSFVQQAALIPAGSVSLGGSLQSLQPRRFLSTCRLVHTQVFD